MIEKGDEKQREHADPLTFDEFPLPNYEDWIKTVEKSLKGVSFENLRTKIYENITVNPIYRSQDMEGIPHLDTFPGMMPFVRGNHPVGYWTHPWEVSQELSAGSPEDFASLAKNALERGQTCLHILLDSASKQGRNPDSAIPQLGGQKGLPLSSLQDVKRALSKVNWESTPLFMQAGVLSFPFIGFLAALAKEQEKDLTSLRGCIGADPFAEWVSQGSLPLSLDAIFQLMADTIRWTKTHVPHLQTLCVQGEPYHNGGGNAVQELAFALATAVEYIRELLERKLSIDEAAAQIRFSFSTGSSFFMEVAKLRAARLLWSKIIEAFGGCSSSRMMYIHARTSARTKTLFDPHVNILRGTVEAFASILGGANSLHVSAFDEAADLGGDMAQRIARNTQLILDKEVHLSKVVDPAGGSWYIESLTHSLAEQAWELFQEVERLGGMKMALMDQFPQQEIEKTAVKRKNNLDYRKDQWVGANRYCNLREPQPTPRNKNIASQSISNAHHDTSKATLERLRKRLKRKPKRWIDLMIESIHKGLTLSECYQLFDDKSREVGIRPIQAERTTASFETLRLASLRYLEQTGCLPKVYLANVGPLAGYKAKTDFSQDFFAAGGFQSIVSKGYITVEETALSILNSGEDIVVLCTPSDVDPGWIQALAKLVKKQKQDLILLLVGKPPEDQVVSYKQAGIDDYIHSKSNCFEMLLKLQKRKGIVP